jgi:hypothetical protein
MATKAPKVTRGGEWRTTPTRSSARRKQQRFMGAEPDLLRRAPLEDYRAKGEAAATAMRGIAKLCAEAAVQGGFSEYDLIFAEPMLARALEELRAFLRVARPARH